MERVRGSFTKFGGCIFPNDQLLLKRIGFESGSGDDDDGGGGVGIQSNLNMLMTV